MTREQKYPNTDTFHFFNANPKGRYTTDCVIRALSAAMDKPYNEIVMELAKLQCETGCDRSEKEAYGKYLESYGWKKMKQPKKSNGTKYTGEAFCKKMTRENPNGEIGNIVAHIGGHHLVCIKPITTIRDKLRYKVYDTWDSTQGCIGNYWTKD